MKITSISIRKVEKENSRLKGLASILINDQLAIHDIRIIEGDNGLFIAMPSRKNPDGSYADVVHPIDKETRGLIHDAIINEYLKLEKN